VAITDHGNMFGVFSSWPKRAAQSEGWPSEGEADRGCEFYLVADRHKSNSRARTRINAVIN